MAEEEEEKESRSTTQMTKDVAKSLFLGLPGAIGQAMYNDPLASSTVNVSPEGEEMIGSMMAETNPAIAAHVFLRDAYLAARDRDPGLALASAFGLVTPFSSSQAKAAGKMLRKFISTKRLPSGDLSTNHLGFKKALDEFVEEFPEETQAILSAGDDTLDMGREIPGTMGGAAKEYYPGGGAKPGTLESFLEDASDRGFEPSGPRTAIAPYDLEQAAKRSSSFMDENPDFEEYLKSSEFTEGRPYSGRPVDMDVEAMEDSRLLSPRYKRTEDPMLVSKEEAMELRRQLELEAFDPDLDLPENLPPLENEIRSMRMDGMGAGPKAK